MRARQQMVDDAAYAEAQARVGNTAESRARWLLDVYQQPGTDAQRLGREMQVFLGPGPDGSWPGVGASRATRWRMDVARALHAVLSGRSWTQRSEVDYPFTLADGFGRVVAARTEDQLIIETLSALHAVRHDLRRCLRDDCRRWFIRNRRQRYCSPQHAAYERTRRRRARVRSSGQR